MASYQKNPAFTANVILTLINATSFLGFMLFFALGEGYFLLSEFDTVSFLTLLLTCIAVILTGIGVFVAILAVVGYNSIKELAEDEARKEAVKVVKEESEIMQEDLDVRVTAIVKRELDDKKSSGVAEILEATPEPDINDKGSENDK